jgi:hypothetical protein
MSLFRFMLTSKGRMKSGKVPRIKLGRFTLSKHAMQRMVERKIRKGEVVQHCYTKPLATIPPRREKDGSFSYRRIGKKITTSMIPSNNLVKTMTRTHSRTRRKYERLMKGKAK